MGSNTSDPADTAIIGVGSPLRGDDALGIVVVERLRQRHDLPDSVDVIDGGTEGLGLIPVIESYRRVMFVDAVVMHAPPGTIRRFSWEEVKLQTHEGALSLHQSDLADALTLAGVLGSLPDEVVIYGVQPHNMTWDAPLSPAVERALPALLDGLINEVRR